MLGRQLTALAVVPPVCAALLGILAFAVLLHASHRSQPLQGRTLAAVLVLGLLLLIVVVTGFVWAGRVARSANAAVEAARVPAPIPAQPTASRIATGPAQSSPAAQAALAAVTSAGVSMPVSADRGVFVHLSHRLQSLVHRQIQLLDALENDVEEPDLLKGLFGVDHLATRMRRHAENLAVLGGAVPRRQWTKPVSVMEVLRSAVSETLDYARVQVIARTPGSLNGYAVADVIHLLAELVENATSFSPPDTKVVLRTQAVAAGLVIEIDDRGLGMTQQEYDRLNSLLREPAEVSVRELLEGARIGLYVVAQLARRHQIAVKLQTNITGGTQALVVLPKTLLAAEQREITATPAQTATHAPAQPSAQTPAQTPAQTSAHAQPSAQAPAVEPMSVPVAAAPPAPASATVAPRIGEQGRPFDASPPPAAIGVIADFDDPRPPTGRPVYGIDGALPAPRRAPSQQPFTAPAPQNGPAPQNQPAAPGMYEFAPPAGPMSPNHHLAPDHPSPGASGYAPPGPGSRPGVDADTDGRSSSDPRNRPPLPRRRPQEHLAAPLAQTTADPADRVGEGLTPNLMADFRRGLVLGSTEPHSSTEPRGGQPHEHPPTQEGQR